MDPMNIALLLLWLFLYISSSLAQSDPTFLDLSINPTITVGQSFNATWRWSGMRIPYAHPLIVTVGQDNQASTTTTSTASPGVNTGVVQLQVSETGSFRATLAMPFSGFLLFPPSTITQTAQFVVVPTTLPDIIAKNDLHIHESTRLKRPLTLQSVLLRQCMTQSIIYLNRQLTNPSQHAIFPISFDCFRNQSNINVAQDIGDWFWNRLARYSTNSTQKSTTPSPTVDSLVGVILGAIFGSLSAFLLLAILVYCVWRHRRRTLPRRNTLSDLNSHGFYPNRMSANSIPSVERSLGKGEEENWDAYTESSLAPSDSVSRVVWSFSQGKKKVRPLATSTALATQSSTASNDSRESKPDADATPDSGRYRSANIDLPYKIPMIIMTTATPSPPSTTVS
ncbi:MAG: hypothetical protein NXY57DRAFT_1100055 [Lentinula lateritia]|nr:MAG: hypothetical protein NXY57DRAFT_1100055 [Lentinula lateritia]